MDPRSSGPNRLKRIYFARAIDGQEAGVVSGLTLQVNEELAAAGMTLVDPTIGEPPPGPGTDWHDIDHYRAIVNHDLAIMKTCDAVLMDMSIANRSYIGCVCEMTYAVSIRNSCDEALGSGAGRGTTRGCGVRDLRLLRVFAVLRDGRGWGYPGFGGC
jgi:hypothetical protein